MYPTLEDEDIEYDYKKRGDAIDIATSDDTYFVFPLTNPDAVVTVTPNPLGAAVVPSYIFVNGLYVNDATASCFLVIVAPVFVYEVEFKAGNKEYSYE